MSPNGELTYMAEPIETGPNPSYHTFDPAETTLYVANETDEFEGKVAKLPCVLPAAAPWLALLCTKCLPH